MKIEHNLGKEYYNRSASPKNLKGPVSKSLLWAFHKSPFKWMYGSKDGFSPTPAMELGSLIHCMVLTPALLNEEFIVSPYDSFRTNDAKDWRDEHKAQGISVVSQEMWDTAHSAYCELMDNPLFPASYDYNPEVAVFGEIDGVEIKGMIDMVHHPLHREGDSLYDLKTTASIESEDALQRLILNRGYHWQAALYLDLYNKASGDSRDSFVFVFIETCSPYETAFVRITSDFIQQGRREYMAALAHWKMCVDAEYFPRKIEGIASISLPKWFKTNL
jgi:hypothetical protein